MSFDSLFTVGVAGLVLYSLLAVGTVSSFFYSVFCRKGESLGSLATNTRRVFRFYILVFVSLRIVWLVMRTLMNDDDEITFIVNRISIIIFLTAFTLIIFYWAERFHKTYYEATSFLPKLGGIFIVFNVLVYVYQVVIIVLWTKSDEIREGNPLYEANVITDVVLSTAVSLGFLIYGILLFFSIKNAGDGGLESQNKELMKVLFITIIFTACFSIRAFIFIYRPITGKKFSTPLFYTLGYYVPEVIPCLLQIYLAESIQGKQDRDTKFIDDLYNENQDSIDDLRDQGWSNEPANESTRLVD